MEFVRKGMELELIRLRFPTREASINAIVVDTKNLSRTEIIFTGSSDANRGSSDHGKWESMKDELLISFQVYWSAFEETPCRIEYATIDARPDEGTVPLQGERDVFFRTLKWHLFDADDVQTNDCKNGKGYDVQRWRCGGHPQLPYDYQYLSLNQKYPLAGGYNKFVESLMVYRLSKPRGELSKPHKGKLEKLTDKVEGFFGIGGSPVAF